MAIQMKFTKDEFFKGHWNGKANGEDYLILKTKNGWRAYFWTPSGTVHVNPEIQLYPNRGQAEAACNLFAQTLAITSGK